MLLWNEWSKEYSPDYRIRILTIDKRAFFKRVQEDPSLALRILKKMSKRIKKLDKEVFRLKTGQNL